MKNLVWIILLIFLTGCAGHGNKTLEENLIPRGRYMPIPNWFISVPAGDFCFGTAKLTVNDPEVKMSALQNATVNYCKNNNCYVVNKKAIRNTQITPESGTREFQVVVTSDPEQLYKIRDNLQLLDYFWLYDNFIGIYSTGNSIIDTSRIEVWINEKNGYYYPEWFKGDLFIEAGQVFTDVACNSHDLFNAWQEALDAGRVSLAGYSKIKVDASVYHINGVRDKLIALETSLKMNNMSIDKIFIRRYLGSGGPGYAVYLRMALDTGIQK